MRDKRITSTLKETVESTMYSLYILTYPSQRRRVNDMLIFQVDLQVVFRKWKIFNDRFFFWSSIVKYANYLEGQKKKKSGQSKILHMYIFYVCGWSAIFFGCVRRGVFSYTVCLNYEWFISFPLLAINQQRADCVLYDYTLLKDSLSARYGKTSMFWVEYIVVIQS